VTTTPMLETTNSRTVFSSTSTTISSTMISSESSTYWPTFYATNNSDCGGDYNSSSGMIRHPLSGSNYYNNDHCVWIIRAGSPLKITFVSFNTETRYDYLYIRDGNNNASPLLGTFHGGSVPSPVQTRTNEAHLLFTSDASVTRTGFELHWEPEVLNSSVTTPVPTTEVINITTALMLETTNPKTVFSSRSSTIFSTMISSGHSSFWPTFYTTNNPDCGGDYNSSSGRIRHPLSGSNYHNNEHCVWIIRAGSPLKMTFVTFDTETGYDYLYIRDGNNNASPLLGTFHGDSVPSPVQTRTNEAHLLFTSDGSVSRTGFELQWEP
ncbi:unnamed protein product, partial [Meganyctiphanes norvegica]